MGRNTGVAVVVAAIVAVAFVLGATFFEPKHDGPMEKAGAKVDQLLKQ